MHSNVNAQYCTASYTTGTSAGDYIGMVSLGSINNVTSGAGSPYFTYYAGQVTSILPTMPYTLTVAPGTYPSGNVIAAWIDYNQDLVYDATEKLGEVTINAAYPTSATISFVPPVTASTGLTRMRVREVFVGAPIDPCTSETYGEVEEYDIDIVPLTPCTGAPVAGTISPATSSYCAGTSVNLTASGFTLAGGLNFQWQESTNGGASWTNVVSGVGANTPYYQTYPLNTTTMFRLYVECTNSSLADTSSTAVVNIAGPTYALLPYTQDFETWIDYCSTKDVPDDGHWLNTPSTGDEAWRRNDEGGTAGWVAPTGGNYIPASSSGAHSARFHSYFTSLTGNLDLFVDCSQQAGTKTLFFDYLNDNTQGFGFDYLEVLVSTDGGVTFTSQGNFNNSTTWQTNNLSIVSNAPNTIVRFMAHGDFNFDTDVALDNIMVLPPCTGSPIAGNIAPITPCANVPFNMTLVNNNLQGGLTYTWESAPTATGPWTFVNVTNGPVVNTQIATPTYFRCIVTCTGSGLSDTTIAAYIDLATFYYCYCNSQSTSLTTPQNIGNVTLLNAQSTAVLNNGNALPLLGNTSAVNFYTNFYNLTPTPIFKDSTYSAQVTAFSQFSWFSNGYSKIYIDYNRDGIYDPATEMATGGFVNSPSNQMASTFLVPSSAQFGITGMRVVYEVNGTASSVDPCSTYTNGETENYLVNITLPPCATPPVAGSITISDTLTCPGYSVFLEDQGHDVYFNGLTFNWQYSTDGINFSDVPGANLDTLTFTVNSDTWFRFRTTCNLTSNGYSNVVKVSMSAPFACYGNSQAVGGLLDTSDIGAFIISDPSTNNNIYSFITGGPHLLNPMAIKRRSDYTGAGVMDLFADSTYNLSIYHIIKHGQHSDAKVTVFIDYNNNQVYDIPGERVFSGISSTANYYLNGSIQTPVSPAINVGTGLRIVLNNDISNNPASDNGVGIYTSGETEDYLVRFKYKPIFPAGVDQISAIQQVGVYPNPTSGLVYVGLTIREAIDFNLAILSVTGATLQEKSFSAGKGNFVTELDMSGFAKGTYMLKISSKQGNFVRRVVVE